MVSKRKTKIQKRAYAKARKKARAVQPLKDAIREIDETVGELAFDMFNGNYPMYMQWREMALVIHLKCPEIPLEELLPDKLPKILATHPELVSLREKIEAGNPGFIRSLLDEDENPDLRSKEIDFSSSHP